VFSLIFTLWKIFQSTGFNPPEADKIMKCPNCQFENPEGAKFCNECGHRLALTPEISSQTLSFEKRLEKIQQYLPDGLTEKILNQREKIEGERKQVTVMFCDMVGFTPLVDRIGPVEAYRVMDKIYEILIRQVHEYEGTVNQMTGDGVMALFGAPIALEDAPQRALWSALSIHREVARFSDKNLEIGPFRMRIGVNTGPVVVGTLGRDLRVEFKAVGDTVNLASRMEGLADAGATYLTEETFKFTQGLFRFEALGKKVVKGKEKTIPVFKLLSGKEKVYRPRLGSERRIYSKMVGRNDHMDKLELQVMKAINGKGSIVNIIGEAGIGKSRLVAELKRREIIKKTNLFEGRAISIGRNLSFHPVIDFFKQWAKIREDDSEPTAFNKLEAIIRSLVPKAYGEILPFVATLMGMKLSGKHAKRIEGIEGEALEKLILKSLRDLLTRAAELNPLVIVIEDLHWADASSIELLESLFRLAETERILFINVFRPGFNETGERIVETITKKLSVYYVEIVIDPLDEKVSETLISNMLNIGELHHAIIGRIVQRVGGNPFFIEEIVRSFIDNGAIVLKDGSFQITEKINTMTIPITINDVLMARIDRLEEPTRDLVKVASVIGRNFFYRILKEVWEMFEDIDDRLSYLKEIQLIRERTRTEELEYLFKHALAQQAAYESILPHKQKELHMKVADSIEKVFDDRLHKYHGMLAYHYSRAENLEKAEEHLIKAGEEALKSSASNEALHYYQEALDLYLKKYGDSADPEKIAMLEKNIALAMYNRGQYEESVEYFDKALNYYWGESPKHPISEAFKFLSGFLHLLISLYLPFLKFRKMPTQRDNEAVDLFFKKLKAVAIINPKRYFIESFHFYKRLTKFDLTKFELGFGMFAGASSLFSFSGISFRLSRRILDLVRDRVDRADIKSFIIYDFSETLHNYLKGNWKTIKDVDDDLVDKNLSIGEIYWASQHIHWHGLPKIYQGSIDKPKLSVNRLNDIFEIYENDFSLMLKQLLKTGLLLETRKLHDALIEIEEGIEFGQKINSGLFLIHLFSCKAQIQILLGDIEEAERTLAHADNIRRKVDSVPWQLAHFHRSKLECDLYRLNESVRKGNKKESLEFRKKAIKSSKLLSKQSRKVAQHRTESYRLMGVYYWLVNEHKKALRLWNKSIKEGERLGARLELSRTYFEVGKRLLEAQSKYKTLNGIKAEEFFEKATILFNEMDLLWDLDELIQRTRG
jgi:class 3 adenylate cyclase/tetratricopeptide (TPR) repeat protein